MSLGNSYTKFTAARLLLRLFLETLTMGIITHTNQATMFIWSGWTHKMSMLAVRARRFGKSRFSRSFSLQPSIVIDHALLTCSIPRLAGPTVDVIFGQFVSMNTVSFTGMFCAHSFTAQDIHRTRNRIDMGRINAISYATQVVAMQVGRDDIHEHAESQSMGEVAEPLKLKFPIAVFRDMACPDPAAASVKGLSWIDFDFAKKARKKFAVYGNAVRIVVHNLASFVGQIVLGHCGFTSRVALSF